MEEAPLQFIETWNYWGKISALAFLSLAILRLILYYLQLASMKDLKAKYDFINQNEIPALWQATLLLLLGAGIMANVFIGEIGLFWLIIRGFVTLCIGFIIGVIANNMYKFYYPFYMEKRLKKLRFKPRISPKSGKPMKLLSETEEDVYLDEGMQAEEDVYSIDYDVWVDEETGFTKIEKYSGHLHASRCPECNYQTLRVEKEEILSRPTYSDEGELIKHFHCSYCGYNAQNTYRIARFSSETTETAMA